MLLIGSRALAIQKPFLLGRTPRDYDLMCTYAEAQAFIQEQIQGTGPLKLDSVYPTSKGKKLIAHGPIPCEFEIAWPGSSAEEILEAAAQDPETVYTYVPGLGCRVQVASLNLLFLLKKSHRYLKNSPHFLKTMRDYRTMRDCGAVIPSEWQEMYRRREKETYDYSHPNLNVRKDAFFTDLGSLKYVYDHDSIHEAMKTLERPAYTYFKREGSEVACDRKLFEVAEEKVRLSSVLEETLVLALERSQIPHPNTDPKKSFDIALMKVCTSITSGWWREYAYEHYDEVQAIYPRNYVQRFWDAVDSGIVKAYTQPQQSQME